MPVTSSHSAGLGGDDAGDASESLEQRPSARGRDSRDSREQRLGRLLARPRPGPLRVGGTLGGRLDLLAADGEPVIQSAESRW